MVNKVLWVVKMMILTTLLSLCQILIQINSVIVFYNYLFVFLLL